MKYYDEMIEKYGFDDGQSEPDGVDLYREAYVVAMNHLLDKHGSAIRVMAWNRMGLHNGCMIVFVPLEFFKTLEEHVIRKGLAQWSGKEPEYPMPDDAYVAAYEEAMTLDFDDYVHVDVVFDIDGLEDFLTNR